MKKKILLEHHKAIAGAVALNSTRIGGRLDRFIQSEITSASRTTVTTPAGVPNSRTDVKTKVSETEIFAANDGTLTVKEPVSSVRVASKNHSTPGCKTDNCHIDVPKIAKPKHATAPIYESCSRRSANEAVPTNRVIGLL